MSKKILIIGGVAGDASTAAKLRRLDERVLNCCMHYEHGHNGDQRGRVDRWGRVGWCRGISW